MWNSIVTVVSVLDLCLSSTLRGKLKICMSLQIKVAIQYDSSSFSPLQSVIEAFLLSKNIYRMTNPTKMACAPSEDSDQPGHALTSLSTWRTLGSLAAQ